MTTVIGLDPSLSRTGVAVWRDGQVRTFSITTTPDDGPRVARQRIILGQITPYIGGQMTGGRDTTGVIEAVHMAHGNQAQRGRTPLDLAGLHDVLVYALYARGVRVGVARPQAAKSAATGNGNAQKARVLAAVPRLGFSVANSDEGDAAWFMALGVVSVGQKVNGWPDHAAGEWDKGRQKALDGIEWLEMQ